MALKLTTNFNPKVEKEYTIEAYLKLCQKDSSAYASAAERLLKAIGEPKIVRTIDTPKLGRIFSNRDIEVYDAFSDFYGLEETVGRVVGFLKRSAQGLEEKRQILYLLGPVGGGKSSLAERLKELMEQEPFYALKGSPIFESPLGLFDPRDSEVLEIPKRYFTGKPSPWAVKRLQEYKGDYTKFKVVKIYPSALRQIGISRTEPGDDNNQDISSLVGKLDLRKIGEYAQSDTDVYSYSGGLCLGNRGLMEFVEMFKAPLKTLNPLLTAVQEGHYTGTEAIGSIPFDGIVLAHSNESEWSAFKNNKKNEAFIDRVTVLRVPYCLRVSEEMKIYEKLLSSSSLGDAPCAPYTLELLAQFCVLSRLTRPENSDVWIKMKVYNGDNTNDEVKRAKTVDEYRDLAGVTEGFEGLSTRFAFKILASVFNYIPNEVSADPILLFYAAARAVRAEQFPTDLEAEYKSVLKELIQKYQKFVDKEIKKAFLESYDDYGQNMYDNYITWAAVWLDKEEYRDPDTNSILKLEEIDNKLREIEEPAGITNAKDFREEVVRFSLRYRNKHEGKSLVWSKSAKMKDVIESKIFSKTDEILPIASFARKSTKSAEKKHSEFISRMEKNGYTATQVRRIVEWYGKQKTDS